MIPFEQYDIGEHRLRCPACGDKPSKKDLGLTVRDDGSAVARCFRCDFCQTFKPERGAHVAKPSAPLIQGRQQAPQHEVLSDYGHGIWNACKPLKGTIAEVYLMSRQCMIPSAEGHLRFHPALKHPDPLAKYVGPCMVGLITDAVTGTPLSLHRTWVTPTGKADVDPPRALLGNHRKQRGVIRLTPDDEVTTTLAIAEGIETALSVALAGLPVWACIDAGNLSNLPVLDGIESLVIGADNDKVGRAAAAWCGNRWVQADREVRVMTPKIDGFDWNDVINKTATEAA